MWSLEEGIWESVIVRWSGEEVATECVHARERCPGTVRNPFLAVGSLVMEIEVMEMLLVTSFEFEVVHWFRGFAKEPFSTWERVVSK